MQVGAGSASLGLSGAGSSLLARCCTLGLGLEGKEMGTHRDSFPLRGPGEPRVH